MSKLLWKKILKLLDNSASSTFTTNNIHSYLSIFMEWLALFKNSGHWISVISGFGEIWTIKSLYKGYKCWSLYLLCHPDPNRVFSTILFMLVVVVERTLKFLGFCESISGLYAFSKWSRRPWPFHFLKSAVFSRSILWFLVNMDAWMWMESSKSLGIEVAMQASFPIQCELIRAN